MYWVHDISSFGQKWNSVKLVDSKLFALSYFDRNLWLTPFPRYLLKTIISSFTHSALSSHLMLYCIADTNCGFTKVTGIITLTSNFSKTFLKCMRKLKGMLKKYFECQTELWHYAKKSQSQQNDANSTVLSSLLYILFAHRMQTVLCTLWDHCQSYTYQVL